VKRVCSIEVTGGDDAYLAKLKEFATTNTHLAGYTVK